jgi:hypothetical protein
MNKKSKTINVLNKLARNLYARNKNGVGDVVVQFLDIISEEEPVVTKKAGKIAATPTVKTASEKPKILESRIQNLKDIYSLALEHDEKMPFGRRKRGK